MRDRPFSHLAATAAVMALGRAGGQDVLIIDDRPEARPTPATRPPKLDTSGPLDAERLRRAEAKRARKAAARNRAP